MRCALFRTCLLSMVTLTLSLHDALPISHRELADPGRAAQLLEPFAGALLVDVRVGERLVLPGAWVRREVVDRGRSEEHTTELQSRGQLVCRPLLEKKI